MQDDHTHFLVDETAILWILLVLALVLVTYFWSACRRSEGSNDDPDDVVKQRYAAGEIDEQTYHTMIAALQEERTQTMADTNYGFGTHLEGTTFENAVERVTTALGDEGFGVLTEIDVQATLKKKLDADFRRYVILGACNPPLAKRALDAEPDIGLLLPCNVVVQESEGGAIDVSIADPKAMFRLVHNEAVAPVAKEAEHRLRRVIAAVSGESRQTA